MPAPWISPGATGSATDEPDATASAGGYWAAAADTAAGPKDAGAGSRAAREFNCEVGGRGTARPAAARGQRSFEASGVAGSLPGPVAWW